MAIDYDSLIDRPRINGFVLTGNKTGEELGLNSLHIYSTTEKIIGTWIDGKPIYEKVVSGLSISFSDDWIANPDLVTNGETAINARIIDESGGVHPCGFSCEDGGYIYIPSSSIDTTDKYISTIMVQYTKTTD